MIQDVTEANRDIAMAFLDHYSETSLFLLSNLAEWGPRLSDSLNSGNYRFIMDQGEPVAVFCLTRRGNLLAQTGERTDLAPEILQACEAEPFPIQGVLGEWRAAESLWRLLCKRPGFHPKHESKERLYRLQIADRAFPRIGAGRIRRLLPTDFKQWDRLNRAYLLEEKLPLQGDTSERRASFTRQSSAGHWWGAFQEERLVTTVALNAAYSSIGQVGGVYTAPEARRRGLARAAMHTLIGDSAEHHKLTTLVLFTGARNGEAQRLYESLGFEKIGDFGMLFGTWREE